MIYLFIIIFADAPPVMLYSFIEQTLVKKKFCCFSFCERNYNENIPIPATRASRIAQMFRCWQSDTASFVDTRWISVAIEWKVCKLYEQHIAIYSQWAHCSLNYTKIISRRAKKQHLYYTYYCHHYYLFNLNAKKIALHSWIYLPYLRQTNKMDGKNAFPSARGWKFKLRLLIHS